NVCHDVSNGIVDLAHILDGWCFTGGKCDQLLDDAQLIANFFNQRIITRLRRYVLHLVVDETDQRRLSQHFRTLLVKVLQDRRAYYLSAADPSSNANEDDQVLVLM